jgi:hypothetical protein
MTTLDEYSCSLNIHNPEGLSTGVFDDVPGEHLAGRSDADVTLVSMIFQNSRNFPSVICRTFSGLREIMVMWSHVDTISATTFAGCTNLEVLYLNLNELTTIPANVLSNSPRLHTLGLGSNQIVELNANSFTGTGIEFLDLGDNRMTTVDPSWFTAINETLTTLDLVANTIGAIDSTTFSNLRNLVTINLNSNGVTTIAADAFSGLTDLQVLALGNCGLNDVNPAWFTSLAALQRLYLFANGITALPTGVFNPLASLLSLELDDNALTTFGLAPLGASADSIATLMLRTNAISSLDSQLIDGVANLNALFLQGNVCVDANFNDVRNRTWEVIEQLQECFASA